MKKLSALLLVAVCCLGSFANPARASNKVSSPDVTKGQVELEYRGGYDFDDIDKRDGQETHKFIANYGLTDRWRMEGKAVWAGKGDDRDWTYAEWSNRYQVLKDKEGWVKLSLQANYKLALQDGRPDKIEFTALAARDLGQFTHLTNINFENEIGSGARGGTDFNFGWKSKYRYDPHFEPAAEFYADFGKFGSPSSATPDKFMAGPAFSGKIAGGLKYDVGYLFGLNEDTPDGRLKWIFTAVF